MHIYNGKPGNSCGMCCTKISDLSVSFGKNTVLSDINLHIHCGELTALIGPNGAGKSTLFKAIIGAVPHSGNIRFTDFENRQTSRPKIGYVPQFLELDRNASISVLDLFCISSSAFPAWLGARKRAKAEAARFLKIVEAEHLIGRRLGALSGGELQRILLALALKTSPDILLFDEPVSGIDRNGLLLFYNIIDKIRQNFDLTVIIISHDHTTISKFADRFILLNKKVLASGTPDEVLASDAYKNIFGNGGSYNDASL